MKFSFSLSTDLPTEQLWALYEDTEKWFLWEEDLQTITLAGDFQTGTQGEMTLEGQPPLQFVLTNVEKSAEFIDKSSIPDVGDIYFYHELKRHDEQTIVTHSVEFLPVNRAANIDDLPFISQIFADVPSSVFALIEAAK